MIRFGQFEKFMDHLALLSSFEEILNRAAPVLRPKALCLEVCSAKIKPIELMRAARLVNEDSWELFQTIKRDDPFSELKRMTFIKKHNELENRIS